MATRTKRTKTRDKKVVRSDQVRELTAQEQLEKDIITQLEKLGGSVMSDESIERGGTQVRLPENMDLLEAQQFIENVRLELEEETSFVENFMYRPWDGAYCAWNVLRRVFGGVSHKGLMGFWGRNRPEMITVRSGVNTTEKVPWGALFLPALPEVEFTLGSRVDPEAGMLFTMYAHGPRKYQTAIHGVFKLVKEELETASLYRGKAFDGAEEPTFLDLDSVNPAKVVYSTESYEALKANVWTPIEHAARLQELGLPRKRAALVHGDWGTGKTLAAILTAQRAVRAGWTFVRARPGVDDLDAVLATARLYAPCVVFFEDIDVISDASKLEADAASKLLDSFDGMAAKGLDVMVVMTTNHIERIHKGMVRPGRLDAVIQLGALDAPNTLRLLLASIPEELVDRDDVMDNSVEVTEAHEGYTPAFVVEAAGRAIRYAVSRTQNGETPLINGQDLINSARGLRNQLELMQDASEGEKIPSLDDRLRLNVRETVKAAVPEAMLEYYNN